MHHDLSSAPHSRACTHARIFPRGWHSARPHLCCRSWSPLQRSLPRNYEWAVPRFRSGTPASHRSESSEKDRRFALHNLLSEGLRDLSESNLVPGCGCFCPGIIDDDGFNSLDPMTAPRPPLAACREGRPSGSVEATLAAVMRISPAGPMHRMASLSPWTRRSLRSIRNCPRRPAAERK